MANPLIIFGLGNPGSEYEKTRHNIGFIVLEHFARDVGATWVNKPKFKAEVAEVTIAGQRVILAKPTTFYNEVGQSARALVDFYKCNSMHDFLAVHDDLALTFGTLRVREKGGDAGNNGIKSLNSHLGPVYKRLRIGIKDDAKLQADDRKIVLGKLSWRESRQFKQNIAPHALKLIHAFIDGELEATSHSVKK